MNGLILRHRSRPAKRCGRKRNVDVRDVVNGLMYILSGAGCQWRAIPKDLPPRLFGYFELWDYDGTLDRGSIIVYTSNVVKRIGREASPTACVIDSQSVNSFRVKGAEKCGGLHRSVGLRCG